HDPHWLAAPFDRTHFTGRDVGNIDLDGRSGRAGLLGRREGADKRHCRRNACHTADGTGRSYPETARWIRREVGVNRWGIIELCRNLTHSSILIHALPGHTIYCFWLCTIALAAYYSVSPLGGEIFQ